MIIYGVADASHDSSLSVIKDGEILFAAHSERYSKVKNDWFLNKDIVDEALSYGVPEAIAYYEKPILKKSRIVFGGGNRQLPSTFKKLIPVNGPVINVGHHRSHASAGYYTSPFQDAVVVVLDAIGEWDTSSVWVGEGKNLKKVYANKYPYSFGLFYSAFTQLLGLEPNKEEYILMGMSGYGNPDRFFERVNSYFPRLGQQKYSFHKGIVDWHLIGGEQEKFDIAASVQRVFELRLLEFMELARRLTGKRNLVYMGGCALNALANTKVRELFNDVWIMPNPGDAGSSLGAAASLHGSHLNWNGPYLGHSIDKPYEIDKTLSELLSYGVSEFVGGRAEFGPRALGNRSLLADPRDESIKDKVNLIKKRELFRPFAPVVLEEYASDWFDMEFTSPYMQYIVKVRKPQLIPSVVHVDGTARVQTVSRSQHPELYKLLLMWYKKTGVPVLLNTSLNIKNQPILNDKKDLEIWKNLYRPA